MGKASRLGVRGLRLGLILGLCGYGGVQGAWAQAEPTFPGNPFEGRQLFADRACYRCHAIWGNGGTLGPDFASVGAGRSLQQLAGLFWNHTPRMIDAGREEGFEWPTFTETELADIISYVYYVKLFDEPGDPEMGERWFVDRQCAQCHTLGDVARAGLVPLDGYARYRSPVMLAQGMWNHGRAMRAQQAARGMALPALAGREVADLLAYIRRASRLRDREVVLLDPPDPNVGERLFRSKGCSICHGVSGRGSSFAPDLHEVIPRLNAAEVAGQLWNHSATMASAMAARGIALPRFEGSQMADVIAYLYYLRFYETGGDVVEGESVFHRKGCSACHAAAGVSAIGPDLSQSGVTRTVLGLATAMWNHAPGMYALLEPGTMNDWPRFEGDEMANLAAYLMSVADSAEPEP